MLEGFSQRLLTFLQLTRMALVFTAIADSYATALMLRAVTHTVPGYYLPGDMPGPDPLDPHRMLSLAAISIGLYGFGMSLNDIADRRRDQQLASHRPLPSGRVGVYTAHAMMILLVLGAMASAAFYALVVHDWRPLYLALGTGALITFYDLAGKYLVAPGLLALGFIRFLHALIASPQIPVPWHPLFLLNHVAILSAVAYHWEDKRPPLTRIHWTIIIGTLIVFDAAFLIFLGKVRGWHHIVMIDQPAAHWPLVAPFAAALVFVGIAWYVRTHAMSPRHAGQTMMLYGLLWLIVYDAAFVGSYTGLFEASLLVLLFPLAYVSVQLMRWWSKILSLSQKPVFKRARM